MRATLKLLCFLLCSLPACRAGEYWLRVPLESKPSSSSLFNGTSVALGDSSSVTTQFKQQNSQPSLLNLRQAPSSDWNSRYLVVYHQQISPSLSLDYSPQLAIGTRLRWTDPDLPTEGDYFDQKQATSLNWQAGSKWKLRGFAETTHRVLLQDDRQRDMETFGADSSFTVTRWTTLRLAERLEASRDHWSEQVESKQISEIELSQKLGESPFRLRLLSGLEEQTMDDGLNQVERTVPRTEGVLTFSPVQEMDVSLGLRLRSSDERNDGKTADTQTLFGEWNQTLTPTVGLRLQALYETNDEAQSGLTTQERERAQLVVGPRVKLNEGLDARMEFQISDEQNKLNSSADQSEERVSFSIQGNF
jgi:hypothetical protein